MSKLFGYPLVRLGARYTVHTLNWLLIHPLQSVNVFYSRATSAKPVDPPHNVGFEIFVPSASSQRPGMAKSIFFSPSAALRHFGNLSLHVRSPVADLSQAVPQGRL